MKIAIASNDGISISSHFGRAAGFVVFDVEDGKVKERLYRKNEHTGHALGMEGSGPHFDRHGIILDALKDCDTVIAHGMGRRIYDDLQSADIQPFIVEEDDVLKAVHLYLENKLEDHPQKGCVH
jgi:predicted Fe-Mo cluster-binding NifX family protein